jgi:hypothetical protein
MWDGPSDLSFGLALWRLHTMANQVERPWECTAKGLDFGLGLFNPFLWTLDKVWPLNPMASRLGWPLCEAALRVGAHGSQVLSPKSLKGNPRNFSY